MSPAPRTSLRTALALAATAAAALAACNRPAQPKPADAERPPVTVELGKVAAADLEQAVEVVGALSARTAADVKSEYSGTVTEILVAQWVQVKRGAVLARLDGREASAGVQAARAAVLQAEVAGQRAARERTRTQQLQEAGLATRQATDEAQTAEAAAQAQVAAVRAQLDLAETRMAKAAVRAPIDGVVAERNVDVGDYFEAMGAPAPMFRIVDPRVLELVASVPTSRIAELAVGQALRFTTDARPGQELEGKLSFINPTADETSRTVKVKAEIPNADLALKPGLFAKGRIVTGRREGVLVVPRAALVSWDSAGRSGLVFVVEGGVAHQRKVETGAATGDGVEVRTGLEAGDEVVTRGGFNLRDGDKVRAAQGA
jgi:membrane fusion protein, multidrug efflux system